MIRGIDIPIIGSKTTGLTKTTGTTNSTLSSMQNKASRRKSRERRWTVGIEREQLPLHTDKLQRHHDDSTLHLSQDHLSQAVSSTSLVSIDSDLGSSTEFANPPLSSALFSQQDVLQDIAMWSNQPFMDPSNPMVNHQHHLSYEQAIDNFPLSPSNYGMMSAQQISLCNHIIHELVTTERSYVSDLTDIIEGYLVPLSGKIGTFPITEHDIACLFGNIREIRDFNMSLLHDLQICGKDIHRIAQCFICKSEAFKIYSQYCNNYPRSVETLQRLSNDKSIAAFLKLCQAKLNHLLLLGAYLLKPVQRVLKYSPLLRNIAKHVGPGDTAYNDLQTALTKMLRIGDHINAMKKKYDAATVVQELQHLLHGWEGPNLTVYGDVVFQDTFRVAQSSRSGAMRPHSAGFRSGVERYVFLFQKILLIVKKKEEGYLYKHHAEMKDMQLTEHLKDAHSFQIRQISTKSSFTFQARTVEQKEEWTIKIKQLLMESVPHLPDKAKLLILAGFPTDLRKSEGASPTASDRRRKVSAGHGKLSPQPPPILDEEAILSTKLLPDKLILSKTLPREMFTTGETSPNEEHIKLSMSLGSFRTVGPMSTSRKHREEEFRANEPDDALGSHTSPRRKGYMAHLPFPLVESWQRSDSDPLLLDRNPTVETTRSQTNSPEHHQRKSQIHSTSSHSENSSPVPPITVSLPANDKKEDSELDTTLQAEQSSFSPAPADQTLTAGDLNVNGIASRTSSPSLNLESFSASSDSLSHGNEDPAGGFKSARNMAQSTTSSQSSSSSLQGAAVVGTATNTRTGSGLQQTPISNGSRESASHPLQTLAAGDEGELQRKNGGGHNITVEIPRPASGDALLKQSSVSPVLDSSLSQEDDLQKPFLLHSSPEAAGSDTVIPILPLDDEISGKEMNVSIIEPPSMFAVAPSPDVPQYTLNTESDQDAHENQQEQLLLDLISNNTEFKRTASSPLIPVTDDAVAIRRIIGQPQEYSEDEMLESGDNSPLCIKPPKQFDGLQKGISSDDEIVTPLASPIPPQVLQAKRESISVEADETTPKASPVFFPKFYRRRGTPYTSIEDLPSAENKDSITSAETSIIPCPPQFAGSDVSDPEMADNDPAPLPVSVKRSSSFEHKYQIGIHQTAADNGSKSSQLNGSKKADASEGSKKFSTVVRRAHSFSKTRRIQRPISVIGLVHSTRDISDLVDLDDAMRFKKLASSHPCTSPQFTDPSLTDREEPSTPPSSPSSNEAMKEMMKRESSFHYLSSTEAKPVRERRQRWSLLRSNRQKPKKDKSEPPTLSSTSEDSCPQANKSNSLPRLKQGEKQNQPSLNLSPRSEQAPSAGGSLFSKPIYRNAGGGNRLKKDVFFGIEVAQETAESPSPPPSPVLDSPNVNRTSTKVQQLAREYSRKIKDRRDHHLAPTGDYSDDTSTCSQGSQIKQSPSPSPDRQLNWMQLIKFRKAGRQRLTSSDTMGDSDSEIVDLETSESDHRPGHEHPSPTHNEPSVLLRNETKNTESPALSSTTEQKRARRKSYTDTSLLAVEESLDAPRDGSFGMMRHAGSEMLLSAKCGVPGSPDFDDIHKATRFGGWVKSLVHKFSSK